jgi:predicted phage terminase large subunit-like protein
VQLVDDDNRKSYYKTSAGGYRLSTTRGSRATGEHPDFIIFEDPLSVDQSASALEREAWRSWYNETISSRGVARSVAHVISQQRTHPDDPSSVALEQNALAEASEEEPPWHHVCLPMRFDPERAMTDRGYGGDWRKEEGELLFPQVFTEEKVRKTERSMGQRVSQAQLQQNPVHSAGRFFDVSHIKLVDSVPTMDRVVRGVDRAATAGGGCYTAGVLLGFVGEQVYVLDVSRGQWAPDEVLAQMQTWCILDEARYGGVGACTMVIEQEPGSGGKESAQNAIKRLKGHRVKAVRPTTNKEARAEPLANAIAVGEVFLLKGRWNADFLEELRSFPGGKYKDQVDAAAGAYVAGLNPQVTRRKTIMAGLEPTQCASKGCERPAASGSQYCCDKCEGAAAFEDPELVKAIDHTHSCNARLGNLELSQSSIPTAAERRRELALAGMRR